VDDNLMQRLETYRDTCRDNATGMAEGSFAASRTPDYWHGAADAYSTVIGLLQMTEPMTDV
jgi:hypothetical protein